MRTMFVTPGGEKPRQMTTGHRLPPPSQVIGGSIMSGRERPDCQAGSSSRTRLRRTDMMVLAHAGDNELIVPFVLIIGLLLIMRGGDPKPDDKPPSRDARPEREDPSAPGS
jgi:hypothetical protein